MPQLMFKLHSSSVAMNSEDNHREVITIPASALVALVAGDINGKGVVKIRYQNQPLEMLAIDLRTRGVLEQSV
jgi:hypothetical protein